MFQIREQHLNAFESHLLARLHKLVERYIEERHAAGALDQQASMASLARAAVDQAWGHGIERLEDVREFVDLTMQHGQHFETQPQHSWMAEILNDPAMDGEEKMARILDRLNGAEEEPEDLDDDDDDEDEDEDEDEEEGDEDEDTGDEDSDSDEDKFDPRELLDLPEESED